LANVSSKGCHAGIAVDFQEVITEFPWKMELRYVPFLTTRCLSNMLAITVSCCP
jgi:hypothetical protein